MPNPSFKGKSGRWAIGVGSTRVCGSFVVVALGSHSRLEPGGKPSELAGGFQASFPGPEAALGFGIELEKYALSSMNFPTLLAPLGLAIGMGVCAWSKLS